MVYYSQAWQDEFVANILNFKKNGYFIDIGSSDGINQSNSYFFESELKWQGICVEMGPGYTEHYKNNRSCIFLNEDATQVNYKKILSKECFPKQIDYLSVDIDENSMKALNVLPFDEYKFSVLTIEGDAYRLGDTMKNQERELLRFHGYYLLFSIFVPLGCGSGPNLPFEDWWIDPKMFNMKKISALAAENIYPDDVIALLKQKKDNYLI